MVFNHIWIFFLLCSLISYQVDCSYIYYQGIKNVDFYKITNGVWWEYQTFNKENLNEPHDCLATKFYADSSKQTLTIIEDYVATTYGRDETIHTRREYTVGTRPNPNENGYLGSMYSEKGTKLLPTVYKVLGTDYKSWLVVYICSRSETFSGGTLFTRSKKVESPFKEELERQLNSSLVATGSDWETKSYKIFNSEINQNEECKDVEFPRNLNTW